MLFIAASVQGWTQTGTNGGNLTWPGDLGLKVIGGGATHAGASDTTSCVNVAPEDQWRFAAVNAAPYLAASV